jgi:hypothetical protein
MKVSLQEWARSGRLIRHKTSPQEISDLLGVADRDIQNSQVAGLSPDWQLGIAYNAVLQIATAALAARGYRASRESHHYWTLQTLTFTVSLDKETLGQLDQFRKKRNISDYERAGIVSDQEAREMIALARKMRRDVEKWLRTHFPELMRK